MKLTRDDDVAAKLCELARRRRVLLKEVVNSVLRRGLTARGHRAEGGRPFPVAIFRSRFRPGVDPHKLNQLEDAL